MAKKNLDAVQPIEITVEHSTPMASSLQVAKHFGKRHDNVLRDIADLKKKVPVEWYALNFEDIRIEVKVPASGGFRKDPAWMMTMDGFSILAMGFNGEKAMQWKIKYIEAFKAMEKNINQEQIQNIRQEYLQGQEQNQQERLELPWQMKEEHLEGMRTVINGLTKFWAVTDGITEATATKILCAALKIISLDDFKREHFAVAWGFIMRALFVPDGEGEEEVSEVESQMADRYSEAIGAILDAVFQLNATKKWSTDKIFFDACFVSSEHFLKAKTQKRVMIIWGLFQYWCGYSMATLYPPKDAEKAEL